MHLEHAIGFTLMHCGLIDGPHMELQQPAAILLSVNATQVRYLKLVSPSVHSCTIDPRVDLTVCALVHK